MLELIELAPLTAVSAAARVTALATTPGAYEATAVAAWLPASPENDQFASGPVNGIVQDDVGASLPVAVASVGAASVGAASGVESLPGTL